MNVIGINGSPRRNKNSATMLEYALSGARDAGAEVERVDLFSLNFKGCISCFQCKRLEGSSFAKCAVKDDLTPILEEVLSADAVILSAPIYFGEVPGRVKNFLERLWFPGLLYRKDGSTGYSNQPKIGLIYTMNNPDAAAYQDHILRHKQMFEWLFGQAEILCATDTLQFDDYSKYSSDLFDEQAKRKTHETRFPLDCNAAYELGALLVRKLSNNE